MVTKFGQFKKLKCLNFVNCPNGQVIARDIKKNHSPNATKNGNKVGTIYKVGTFQLFKLSQLCYHFLLRFVEFFFC